MLEFFAQISAPQQAANGLFATLIVLTHLSRTQIRVFSAESQWNYWGS